MDSFFVYRLGSTKTGKRLKAALVDYILLCTFSYTFLGGIKGEGGIKSGVDAQQKQEEIL